MYLITQSQTLRQQDPIIDLDYACLPILKMHNYIHKDQYLSIYKIQPAKT